MASVTYNSGFWFPPIPSNHNEAGIFFTSQLIDSATECVGTILMAPSSGTISAVSFRVHSAAQVGTVEVRIETVRTNGALGGNRSGVLWSTGASGWIQMTSAKGGTWQTVGLGSGVVITQGSIFAVAYVNTFTNLVPIWRIATFVSESDSFPYSTSVGVGTGGAHAPFPTCMSVMYSDSTYKSIPHIWPMSNIATSNLVSSKSEQGLLFIPANPCRVTGMYAFTLPTSNFDINLYNNDGSTRLTTLRSNSMNRYVSASPTFETYPFASAVTLLAGNSYRCVITPLGPGSITLPNYIINDTKVLCAWPGGNRFMLTTASSPVALSGGWVNTELQRPPMGLIFDQFDDGVQTGGSSTYGYGFV